MCLSLYIHIPFCKSKCYYCSFNSIQSHNTDLIDEYIESLKIEASYYKGKQVSTIYIGGGTPTYLNRSQLESIFRLIQDNFNLSPNSEFSIEANPTTFDQEKSKFLKHSRINRVSLGVQSLNDKLLRFLGRTHNAADAIKGFRFLRDAGFKNINIDVIYSIRGQNRQDMISDVKLISSFESEHLSLYSLSLEKGSILYKANFQEKAPQLQAYDYKVICDILKSKGFIDYEVSNFAKNGFECRHNIAYWRCYDYIGLGAGVHSHINGQRFWNAEDIVAYITKIRQGLSPIKGKESLSKNRRLKEAFLIGLRMSEGINLDELEKRFRAHFDAKTHSDIDEFINAGFFIREKNNIKTTFKGRMLLDEISSRIWRN